MLQTRDGYLWLGTFGGLVRFDGIRFTIFNTANTPALHSNRVMALYEDADGMLWIGTETGDIVREQNGSFEIFKTGDGSSNNVVLSFLSDQRGDLWVGQTFGIWHFAAKQSNAATFYSFNQGVSSIVEDGAGDIWLGTGGSLIRWQNGNFSEYQTTKNDNIFSANVIQKDSAGNLWTITGKGVGRFENGEFKLLLENSLNQTRYLTAITPDKNKQVWFGYYESVYKLGESGVLDKYDLSDLTKGGIRSMMFDREGNLWIGTNGDGLIRLSPRKIKTLSTIDGLASDEITTIIEDSEGKGVWIGGVGLTHWQNGQKTIYKVENGLPANRITALRFASDGTLWIGTLGGLASLKDGKISVYPASSTFRASVKTIFEDSQKNLWFGWQGGGLELYRNGEFKTYKTENGLIHNDVRFITEDRTGQLWIGTVGGISTFKTICAMCDVPESIEFTNFNSQNGLSNNFVRDIYEAEDDTFWIGTYGGGLNRLRNGKFTAVTIKDGLGDDFISRILPDGRGNFWLLGNRGIFSVSRQILNDFADGNTQGLVCGSYGAADGMLSSEGNGGNSPAGSKMKDGTLWFPMIKGVTIIDPKIIKPQSLPVLIEEVTLDREELDTHSKIVVNPGQENLEIHYTGLSFSKPEQVRFRYKLENLDTNWTEAGTRRIAYFPHLPPGDYRFTVIAANSDAVWSDSAAILEITVLAPFWMRWWFIVIVVFFFFGLLAFSYQFRLNHLERRRATQEELSRHLINAHETERQRIAAELHDGLGQSLLVIKNRSMMGEMSATGAKVSLEQFKNISEAAAHAIEEVRHITYNLRPYHLNRLGLTQALEEMIEKVADSTPIAFENRISLLDDTFRKDEEVIFYRIIQECVNNILKHSNASQAKIEISRHERDIFVKISDNGQGFVPKEDNADPSHKGGFGLIGMAERVRMLGGTHAIESSPEHGTTVTVKINLSDK
ncbi:MAG: hypothetical protein K1X72_26565 [Pyrinomonadaceae bacterium]|nr:hypothetical protein [Pyrinomonadaceae bacterium]